MDFDTNIREIENKIGYSFKDKGLLRQAFTRTSYCNEHKERRGEKYQSNEVLEFFGDSLLSAAIVTLLMKDFAERYEFGISTTLDEGDFSNIKSKLSDKKNLSLATKRLELQQYLLMGEGDAKLGIENEPSVMEDLFESIIGAIYIDSRNDMQAVISSVSRMLDVNEYIREKTPPMQSFKNALQEWCADKKHRREPPVYKTVSETGPDHKKIYERACYIGGKVYGVGQGKNQKLADAAAAEEALAALIREDSECAERVSAQNLLSVQKLKEYAQKEKKVSPEFRDLGEHKDKTRGITEFEIECRFAGFEARACAQSKREAKALAAEKILKLLQKPEKKPPVSQKTKKTMPASRGKQAAAAKPRSHHNSPKRASKEKTKA